MRLALAGLALAFAFLFALAPAVAADASPFIFAPSALAPAPARGWVVLLPGQNELSFAAMQSHLEKTALLLNANGFDTLIVPYDEAYDEDVDGDVDEDGDRIAAVTLRAVNWMNHSHPDTAGAPGAVIAWGAGALGLWSLAQPGTQYPLPNLTAAVAYYPSFGTEAPFNTRVQTLLQIGAQDPMARTLNSFVSRRAPGSVEPELARYPDVQRGFDLEFFQKPKIVRSVPLIGDATTYAYNAIEARAAEQKMLTFLKARLEAPDSGDN